MKSVTRVTKAQMSLQPEWICGLLEADAYPHAVSGLRLIETHISWVFLTGEYVYKVKKPVNLGFVDFSTLGQVFQQGGQTLIQWR